MSMFAGLEDRGFQILYDPRLPVSERYSLRVSDPDFLCIGPTAESVIAAAMRRVVSEDKRQVSLPLLSGDVPTALCP